MVCSQLDTFCFDQRSYAVFEDRGPLTMTLTLSRALPFDISVNFAYTGRNAIGKMYCFVFAVM